jgi:uncharacterized membrane protein
MKAKNFVLIAGIGLLSLISNNMLAQVGTGETYYNSSRNVEEENAQRVDILKQQLKDAEKELKEIRKMERDAKKARKEAKAALKAENQAQKARKQANEQARKAERLMN